MKHMTNITENLDRWFKEKWVDISKKEDGKHPPCGREAASKKHGAYPKCRPSNRVSSDTPETSGEMSKSEKEAAVRQKRRAEKKRRKDKKPHMTSHKDIEEANNFTPTKEMRDYVLAVVGKRARGIDLKGITTALGARFPLVPKIALGKLIANSLEWWEESGEVMNMDGTYKLSKWVKEETENEPTDPALWSKAKALAKSKFRVYPSAYANGWAAKWYKEHGGGWKKADAKESFTGKRFAEFVAEADQVDKEAMPCNKPRPSTRPGKKRMVKGCQDGQEKIVHYGADGYGHNYSAKARASFRARHNCDQAKDKLSAQYWACKDLWAGKGGSTKSCPGGKGDEDCKY